MNESTRSSARRLINKSDLCEAEQRLVELLQDVDFGRIEELYFGDGKPVFDPPPRVIVTLRMQAATFVRDESHLRDFSLKQPVVLLLLLMRQMGSGKILVIHVRHGLPVTVEVERLGIARRTGNDAARPA